MVTHCRKYPLSISLQKIHIIIIILFFLLYEKFMHNVSMYVCVQIYLYHSIHVGGSCSVFPTDIIVKYMVYQLWCSSLPILYICIKLTCTYFQHYVLWGIYTCMYTFGYDSFICLHWTWPLFKYIFTLVDSLPTCIRRQNRVNN